MQNVIKKVSNSTRKRQIRFTGIIACSFISLQCAVWIILAFIGIVCFYTDATEVDTVYYAFKAVYLDSKAGETTSCVISPAIFHLICWFYLLACSAWLFVNVKLIVVLFDWEDSESISKLLKIWIYTTFIACGIDFLMFVLFLVDFNIILHNNVLSSKMRSEYNFKTSKLLEPLPFALGPDGKPIYGKSQAAQENEFIERLREEIKKELTIILQKSDLKHKHKNISAIAKSTLNSMMENPFVQPLKKTKREDTGIIPNATKKFVGHYRPHVPPAILMTISLRGFIIWIINLTLAIVINHIIIIYT